MSWDPNEILFETWIGRYHLILVKGDLKNLCLHVAAAVFFVGCMIILKANGLR